jgi:hypothetical protein
MRSARLRAAPGARVVANTDWFTYLRERQPLDELNFCQSTAGRPLSVLQPGTPFFFRLESPYQKMRAAR